MRRTQGTCFLFLLWTLASCSAAPPAGAVDEDGDTISDTHEGREAGTDTDGDGTPDYLDTDSDGDGVPDQIEAGDADLDTFPPDSDGDSKADFRDTDADDNGLPDGVDGAEDIDGDGKPSFADTDDDGDSMSDVDEIGGQPGGPVDSDGDKTPDFQDEDSDGDTIGDVYEVGADPDLDAVPAYLDLDSDGDCVPDAAEADLDESGAPADGDSDGIGDFLEIDADSDGLADGIEDQDCDGELDAGETLSASADSDGDGATDLVEVAIGTDPVDATDNPAANGDFYFIVPYKDAPTPPSSTLDFSTKIGKADVFFLMDTTSSMGGAITNLSQSLSTIIDTLAQSIPNIALGVGGYDDFPTGGYGAPPDLPFYLLHRIQTVSTQGGKDAVQASVNQLTTHNGGDIPESGWEAVYQAASGVGIQGVGNVTIPPFDPLTAPPAAPPPGESFGDLGGVGFRSGALPIVVTMTDTYSHNSEAFPGDKYSFSGAATRNKATQALYELGAKMLGVAVSGSAFNEARSDLEFAVKATGSFVTPLSWGEPGVDRPPGCDVTQCCTGFNGAGVPKDAAGFCPLVFAVSETGSGLGNAIVKAIEVLTQFTFLDIETKVEDDPADDVDAVAAFVDGVIPNVDGPAPCTKGLTAVDTDGDGELDGYSGVLPGSTACFDVVPKTNTTVPPSMELKVYKAQITIFANDVADLDSRTVYFLVPPTLPDPK